MNNLPKGFYYNKQGVLINSNRTKSSIEKKVDALETELKEIKNQLKCLQQQLKP